MVTFRLHREHSLCRQPCEVPCLLSRTLESLARIPAQCRRWKVFFFFSQEEHLAWRLKDG